MDEQRLKELRSRQELELKKMGINNMEELQKAMTEVNLDISLMVSTATIKSMEKEIAQKGRKYGIKK